MLNHTGYRFRNLLLKLRWSNPSLVYIINDPLGLNPLTKQKFFLCHFNEQKFRHNFQDCVNLLCNFSLEMESINHLFLYCHNYADTCQSIFDFVKKIDSSTTNLSDDILVELLLYGNKNISLKVNCKIIEASIKFEFRKVFWPTFSFNICFCLL